MLVAVGVVCALVLCALWQIHRTLDRTPPNVGAFAHSAATRTAGAAAERTSSARLTNLTSALPWAVPIDPLTVRRPGLPLETAYRVQKAAVARWIPAGARIVGHKAGVASHAMQEQMGVAEPDSGVLLDDMVPASESVWRARSSPVHLGVRPDESPGRVRLGSARRRIQLLRLPGARIVPSTVTIRRILALACPRGLPAGELSASFAAVGPRPSRPPSVVSAGDCGPAVSLVSRVGSCRCPRPTGS
ncbi:hypothetical protein [Streptomyces sp. NPDC002520]